MAADLDPIFVRALTLVHSRHPKSLEQLCALRDEALGKKPEVSFEIKKEDTKDIKKELPKKQPTEVIKVEKKGNGKSGKVQPAENTISDDKDSITVEVESSSLSSRSFKDEELIETVEELSSSFCETLEELDSSSLLLPKKKKPRLLDLSATKAVIDDQISHESSPEHEIVSDLGVHCSICMSSKTNMHANQMVECHECHEHYHQNCHKPNITDQNINDPRHVWYCSTCVKKMKEATSTTSSTSKQKSLNTSGLTFKPPNQSFKPPVRMEGKPPSFSPGSSTVTQSFSIPSFTSATNSATTSTSSTGGPLKSPSNANPRDVTRNSMKRLQMVKKKAAAKNQQRFAKR